MSGYILHTRTDEILDQGRDEGRIEGRIEGRVEGEQNALNLTSYLAENGRTDDIIRAAKDKDFFNQLLTELMPVLGK